MLMSMLPKSKRRGRLKLLANDTNVKLKMECRVISTTLNQDNDLRIRISIDMSRTKTMQAFGSQLANDILSGCENYEYDSNAYWKCDWRSRTSSGKHIYHTRIYNGICKLCIIIEELIDTFKKKCGYSRK